MPATAKERAVVAGKADAKGGGRKKEKKENYCGVL